MAAAGPAFDDRSYEKDVLEPARRLRRPPADLAVRYAIDMSRPLDDAALAAHLQHMVTYWRRIKAKRRFAEIIDTLLVQHTELTGELDQRATPGRRFATLQRVREDRLRRLRERLDGEIRRRTEHRRFLTPDEVTWLVDYCDGAFTAAAVVAAARAGDATVRDPVTVPPPASVPRLTELRSNVQSLGLTLSTELLLGREAVASGFTVLAGFRLSDDGGRVTAELLVKWNREVDRMGHQEPRTVPTRNVLAILTDAVGDRERLDRLLLAEVADVLRVRARGRFEESVLVATATDLGLDKEEAVELAVALAAQAVAGPGSLSDRVDEAMRDRDLSAARRLAAQLGNSEPEQRLRAEVERVADRVTRLAGDADAAVDAGDPESAAVALADLLDLVDDVDAANRLRALAPPPPGAVVAIADAATVTVRWTASTARVGRIRYRVTRTVEAPPALPAVTLEETADTTLTDRDAPPGTRVTYGVAAARDDGVWSAPTTAVPVVVTPEILEPQITADESSVEFRWTPWPRMVGVVVARWEQEPGHGPAVDIRSDLDGFVDTGVRPGTAYWYRLAARYVVSGTPVTLPGTVFPARPEPVPLPVREIGVDVRAEFSADPAEMDVRITWRPPAEGAVTVYAGPEKLAFQPGDLIPAQRAGVLGMPLTGPQQRERDGRVALLTRLAGGRRYFLTAVTRNGSRASVGVTTEVTVVTPVRELTGTRTGPRLRLNWVWPDGVLEARVTWRRDGDHVPHSMMCSLARYRQDNGLDVDVGPEAGTVTVEARVVLVDGPAFGPPAVLRFPAARVRVVYDVAFDGRAVTVTFLADRPCRLPATTVVRGRASFLPARVDQGDVVHVTQAGTRLFPGRELAMRIPLADVRGRWSVVCLAEDPAVYLEPRSRRGLWVR